MTSDPYESVAVRDPLHGFIGISDRERALIDSTNFRRLSRIHQLSHSFLVYPGAVHTRFEHSLGTLHVAGRIARRLNLPPDQEEVVRVAALLHDVGHGPYSHLFETVLASTGVKASKDEQLHEIITRGIIERDPTLEEGLNGIRDKVVETLGGEDGLNSRIVSGALDADKLDYLRRDSLFTGVSYGNFDLERILRSV